MPVWSAHSDTDLWAIVAFLRKLPGVTEQQYAELIKANMMHGMTMHHSEGTMPSAPSR